MIVDVDTPDLDPGRLARQQWLESVLKSVPVPALPVHLALWHAESQASEGVPEAHTLERVICAALAGIHPARAANVARWLDSRVDTPLRSAKEFSWSYMAGWFADRGCEGFLTSLWEDMTIAAALTKLLAGNSLTQVLTRLEA